MGVKLQVFIFQNLKIYAIARGEVLAQLRNRITAVTGYEFKIINDNHYMIDTNFISWHGDNESLIRLKPYLIKAFWMRSHLLSWVI